MTKGTERDLSLVVILLTVALACVSAVRRHLLATHQRVKQQHDVYFLPPAEQVLTLTFGYRAAVADVLWAHVLVSQGLHTFERRRFDNLTRLYDVINLLDPEWRSPYLLADALISFQPGGVAYQDVLKARAILERGIHHRPLDGQLWLILGEFVSYIAPGSYLDDRPEVAERWRVEGVKYLARAAELGGGESHISWQALGGARILERSGEREASIRFLQRTYAVTDDAELKEHLRKRLATLLGEQELNGRLARDSAFNSLLAGELPWTTRSHALALGPAPHPAACAGPEHEGDSACATTWRQWAARFVQQQPGR